MAQINELNPRNTTEELKQQLAKARQTLDVLRGEARVALSLASLEAKQRWAKLSEEATNAELRAQNKITTAAVKAVDEAAAQIRSFLDGKPGNAAPVKK